MTFVPQTPFTGILEHAVEKLTGRADERHAFANFDPAGRFAHHDETGLARYLRETRRDRPLRFALDGERAE